MLKRARERLRRGMAQWATVAQQGAEERPQTCRLHQLCPVSADGLR